MVKRNRKYLISFIILFLVVLVFSIPDSLFFRWYINTRLDKAESPMEKLLFINMTLDDSPQYWTPTYIDMYVNCKVDESETIGFQDSIFHILRERKSFTVPILKSSISQNSSKRPSVERMKYKELLKLLEVEKVPVVPKNSSDTERDGSEQE